MSGVWFFAWNPSPKKDIESLEKVQPLFIHKAPPRLAAFDLLSAVD